jgi:hypothetical protein
MSSSQPFTYRSRSRPLALAMFAWKRLAGAPARFRKTGSRAPIYHVVWA